MHKFPRAFFSFEYWIARLSGTSRQRLVLTRHFFNRLFQNEVVPFEEQMKEKLIVGLVMLAVLGGHVAVSVFGKYGMLEKYIFLTYDPGSWVDKCFFIAFFMTVLAFIVVVDWDIMLLDRRDALNLLPLPIADRTLFQAKFLSFLMFILLFVAAVNAIAVCVVSFFLPHLRSNRFGFLFQYAAAHVAGTTAAFVFTFFLFALVNAALFLVLSPRLYRRVISLIRFGLLAGIVFLTMLLLVNSVIMPDMFAWITQVLEKRTGPGLFFPPLWFTGLYEWLLGNRDPVFVSGAVISVIALLVLPAIYFGAMALSYRRHLHLSAEEFAQRYSFRSTKEAAARIFQGMFLRNGVQRAIYYFVVRTLQAGARAQFQIVLYLSLGIGTSVIFLFPRRGEFQSFSTQNLNVLAIPFILSFFLLFGFRTAVSLPLAAEANWIFQVTESRSIRHYFIGMKKAIIVRALFPLFGLLFVPFAFVWGWRTAALHVGYGLASALVLQEILFWKYPKIPFSCISMPGRFRVQFYWIFYAFGVLIYIWGLSLLERKLFFIKGGVPFGIVIAAVIFVALWTYQNRYVVRRVRIVYEDEPEKILTTLE